MPEPEPEPNADRSQELFEAFKVDISRIKNENLEDVLSKNNLSFDSESLRLFSNDWNLMYEHATTLFNNFNIIKSISGWKESVENINRAAINLRNGQFSDLANKNIFLNNLTHAMTTFINKFEGFKRFRKIPLTESEALKAENALADFVSTAKTIVGADDYESSNLKRFDDLLADTNTTLKDNFRGPFPSLTIDSMRSFVALAAPSMEGKTQAAFTLRRVKPLYFPLSEISPSRYVQDIYRNFHSHTKHLYYCVEDDLRSIEAHGQASAVTTDELSAKGAVKLWTVGFLMRLVEECPMPASENESWMENYSNLNDFYFPQIAIDEIPKDYFKDYCLFLDEYSADTWAIFVRNLARVIGIKCVCSNTNIKITNIVGKNETSGSRGHPVRSVVITRLNSPCLRFLNEKYDLEGSIQTIKNAALRNTFNGVEAKNPVCRFLNDFMNSQLVCLRPGAAVYIAKALQTLLAANTVPLESLTLGKLLDFMVRQLAIDFSTRKPSLADDDLAFYAKIGLLVPHSYYGAKDNSGDLMMLPEAPAPLDPSKLALIPYSAPIALSLIPISAPSVSTVAPQPRTRKRTAAERKDSENNYEDEKGVAGSDQGAMIRQSSDDSVNDRRRKKGFFYQRKFIENHLYYLSNPQITGKWMFLTFLSKKKGRRCLRTYVGSFKKWKHEYTDFETNELLTMFACLSIPAEETISTLLKDADESIYGRPESIYDNPNPRAMKVSGNPLEFSVAVSVADASQHSFETKVKVPIIPFGTEQFADNGMREFTFRGQDGCSFLKNLIVNLIVDEDFDYNEHVINVEFVETPRFKLESDYLKKCTIPYLYSLNRSIPLFDELSDPSTDFFVERYIRTADQEGIDGKFKFLLNGEVGRAVVECKNRQHQITPNDLEDILFKAFSTSRTWLALVFCPELIGNPLNSSMLVRLCRSNKINVYRITKTAQIDFKVVPLFNEPSLIHPEPDHVCILFESRWLNKKFKYPPVRQ